MTRIPILCHGLDVLALTFTLLRSSIQCLRGARSSLNHPFHNQPVDLVVSEAGLPH